MVMLQLVANSGLSLKNTQFKNCISDYQGGAVAVIDTKDSVNKSTYLKNAEFIENSASEGGRVFARMSDVRFEGC